MPHRLNYEDSCLELQERELIDAGEIPPLPKHPPRYDDEEQPGVSFFHTQLADLELDLLTLPRTFFNRSEIRSVSFRDTDLSESTANWNDFKKVDFSKADLSRCDLRGCEFERVKFISASLRGADIRHSTFHDCDFTAADVHGLKLTKAAAASLKFSKEQLDVIAWQLDEGEEPEGG